MKEKEVEKEKITREIINEAKELSVSGNHEDAMKKLGLNCDDLTSYELALVRDRVNFSITRMIEKKR